MIRALVIVVAIVYPFIVYFGTTYVSPSVMAACLAVIVLLKVLVDDMHVGLKWLALVAVVAAVALHWWMRGSVNSLMFWPVLVNSALFLVFGLSLFWKQSLIEIIARKRNMDVGSHNLRYLRVLTGVWAGFFVLSVIVSGFTVVNGNMDLWLLYNGLLSYLLMGVLIVGELIVRYFYKKRINRS